MLKKGFYFFVFLFGISFLFFGSHSVYGQEKIRLKYAGGPEGSGIYRSALAISELVNKYSKRLEIAVQVSPGSRKIPAMLEDNMVQIGAGGSTSEIWATEGLGDYKGKPCKMVRRLVIWGASFNIFFSPAKYNIKSIEDLPGKKIGIGAKTSPTGKTAAEALKLFGLEGKAKWYNNTSATELGERIKDGIYQCGLYGVSHPWSILLDLTSTMKMNLFGVSGKNLEKVVKWSKGRHFPAELPANVYPNQPDPIATFGSTQSTLVRADVPDDVVLEILNILDDHYKEFTTSYPPAKVAFHNWKLQARKLAPYHPGTIKWLKKHGVEIK